MGHSAEREALPCICLPVPRSATLDGRDGWLHTVDDCQWHGRNYFGNRPTGTPPTRLTQPAEPGADRGGEL